MTRGNQRDLAREKNAKKMAKGKSASDSAGMLQVSISEKGTKIILQ